MALSKGLLRYVNRVARNLESGTVGVHLRDLKVGRYLQEYMDARGLQRADTLSGLANVIGFDLSQLRSPVENYNLGDQIGANVNDSFGRERDLVIGGNSPCFALGPVYPYSADIEGGIDVTRSRGPRSKPGVLYLAFTLRVLQQAGSTSLDMPTITLESSQQGESQVGAKHRGASVGLHLNPLGVESTDSRSLLIMEAVSL